LSPRGELADGSLGLKARRKRAFLGLARSLGLYADVWIHATGPEELADIQRRVPGSRGILVAPNVRTLPERPPQEKCIRINDGVTRLAFLGRISRVKNLDYALEVLRLINIPVVFDIYGPVSDPDYWRQCKRIIASLPSTVSVSYKGEISKSSVQETLARYDLLFLPTRGENFGHAIFEALASGLPILISDRTPWKLLEQRGAGWSLPLSAPQHFATAIEIFARLDDEERSRLRRGAWRAAVEMVAESDAVARTRAMFHALMAPRTYDNARRWLHKPQNPP
jgi:glycosyltransferase involved in cell wall biosynthesis